MFDRVANLTWKHPKLVLAAVAVFAVLSVAIGHDVEHHLKAAGFTDPASESEQAKTILSDALGYDPNPAIVLVVRDPDGAPTGAPQPRPPRQGRGAQPARSRAVDGVGRVIDPLREPRAGAELIAADGRSLVLLVDLSRRRQRRQGRDRRRRSRTAARGSRPLEVSMGGYAPGFNEVNDQTKADLTKAELIAFPILALLLLFVFRGVVAAGIPLLLGVISIVGTLFVLRMMSMFVDTSVFALNIATGLRPRAGGRLRAADGLQIQGGDRPRRADPRGAPAHGRRPPGAPRSSPASPSPSAMAALVVMPQRFLYSMAVAGASVGILSAMIAILVVPSMLALLGNRIDALSIRKGPAVSDESDGWYRLARWVMRHPVGVALASTALLLAAAAPLLITTLTGPNSDFVPEGKPS